MLENSKAFSSFSVDDIEKATKFYGDILGMEVKTHPWVDDYWSCILKELCRLWSIQNPTMYRLLLRC